MSGENSLTSITVPANADLSAGQYCFVTVNSSGKVALTGDGGQADGILQNDPDAADRAATVAIAGVSYIKAGSGGLTAGDQVASGANGVGITAGSADYVMGKALETGAENALVPMIFQPNAKLAG